MISKIGWASAKLVRTVLVTLPFLVLSHHSLRAQTQASSASFSGTIADPVGARLPNAKVILSNPEKGISCVYTTDASGNFSFRIVPPGNYDLTVEAGGLKTYYQQGFALEVGQDAAQNIVLEVGSAQEQITVSAEAPILNTDNANVAAEISGPGSVIRANFLHGTIGANGGCWPSASRYAAWESPGGNLFRGWRQGGLSRFAG